MVNEKIQNVLSSLEKVSAYETRRRDEIPVEKRLNCISKNKGMFYNTLLMSINAKKILDAYKLSYDEINIMETPPSKSVLKKAIKARGMKKLFNTSGEQYKKLRIKDKIGAMTEAQAIELLSSNGRLVKRPIAVDGNRITVGFNEIEYKEVWS